MRDIFGNELSIGDQVALKEPYSGKLVRGSIIRFTTQQVRVTYTPYGLEDRTKETIVPPRELVKNVK